MVVPEQSIVEKTVDQRMVDTEGNTQTLGDQYEIVAVVEVAVAVQDSHLPISLADDDLLEAADADVQLRRERFPDTFLHRDRDLAAFRQVVMQTTAGRIAGGRDVDPEEVAQIQQSLSTYDAGEIGVARESLDTPRETRSAEKPVRDRDAYEYQVGGSSQRNRHRSHRRLQQTVHTAGHDGPSSGSKDHNVRYVGGAFARRVRRSCRLLQDHRLPVSVRV